ncbi:enteropeptidase-like [Fundulus diaphanus]
MARRLSSLVILLSVISSLLLICCITLIVVSWVSLKPEGADDAVQLSGQMVITAGAEFSDELRNSSSEKFKSLAFDLQQLVLEAFSFGDLLRFYRFCQVQHFSPGSVVVTFDLWFSQRIATKKVEQQLGAGLHMIGGGALVIDIHSMQITEKPEQTTSLATTITSTAATACDGQFVLEGPSGSFTSSPSEVYNSSIFCRWIIRSHTDTNAVLREISSLG